MAAWYHMILLFTCYSILGWICETFYCSIPAKHFINRGFLYGPVCPIYGFGAICIIWFLLPLRGNIFLVFLLGLLLTSSLEYLTSLLLEKLFQAKWWDYSHMACNIHGRVCLLNAVLFGLMSVLLIEFLHPFISRWLPYIPSPIAAVLAATFLTAFIIDCIAAIFTILSLNYKLKQLHELADKLKYSPDATIWYYQEKICQGTDQLRRRINQEGTEFSHRIDGQLTELLKKRFGHQRLIDAFPSMSHLKYQQQLQNLKTEWNRK